jgi:nicotinic acid mononucleotide adenylyltransferase
MLALLLSTARTVACSFVATTASPVDTCFNVHHSGFWLSSSSNYLRRSALPRRNGFSRMASNGNDDYSFERLRERMSEFVASQQSGKGIRFVIAIAGGGGHFLSTLQATPGASACLLEGIVTYDRESYNQFVQYRHLGRVRLQSASGAPIEEDPLTWPRTSSSFSYCSAHAAALASDAARQRALQIGASSDTAYGHAALEYHTRTYGIGVASSLRSVSGLATDSRAHVHVSGPRLDVACTAQLSPAADRNRFDEDVFVSHCILDTILYTLQRDKIRLVGRLDPSLRKTSASDIIRTYVVACDPSDRREVIQQAAASILSGEASVALLLPSLFEDQGNSCWTSLVGTEWAACLPPQLMVFPGSFNPPHKGHMMLTQASMESLNAGPSFSPDQSAPNVATLFELSLINADKPPLAMTDVIKRVESFWDVEHRPENNWGIVLTSAPLFVDKVDLLQPLVRSRPSHPGATNDQPGLSFVIGTDTLVRLLNSKYYDGSDKKMIEALRSLRCRFIVGGRLDQTSKNGTNHFVTGEDDVSALPLDLQQKFTLLADFRVDLSSSEIRASAGKAS